MFQCSGFNIDNYNLIRKFVKYYFYFQRKKMDSIYTIDELNEARKVITQTLEIPMTNSDNECLKRDIKDFAKQYFIDNDWHELTNERIDNTIEAFKESLNWSNLIASIKEAMNEKLADDIEREGDNTLPLIPECRGKKEIYVCSYPCGNNNLTTKYHATKYTFTHDTTIIFIYKGPTDDDLIFTFIIDGGTPDGDHKYRKYKFIWEENNAHNIDEQITLNASFDELYYCKLFEDGRFVISFRCLDGAFHNCIYYKNNAKPRELISKEELEHLPLDNCIFSIDD